MIWARRQVQVLRLLRAHRYMDAAQVHQVVYHPVSRRACQRCLTTLHQQGLVVRARSTSGAWAAAAAATSTAYRPKAPTCWNTSTMRLELRFRMSATLRHLRRSGPGTSWR